MPGRKPTAAELIAKISQKWEEMTNEFENHADLVRIDNVGYKMAPKFFDDYFSGVDYSVGLRMLLNDQKINYETLVQWYKELISLDNELESSSGVGSFMESVLPDLMKNNNFNQVKAKVLIESQKISPDLYTKFRFCGDIDELKEAIERELKYKFPKKVIKEEEEVEYVDDTQLVSDLSSASASLGEALSALYPYKTQYIQDESTVRALAEIRQAISVALQKVNGTMVMLSR